MSTRKLYSSVLGLTLALSFAATCDAQVFYGGTVNRGFGSNYRFGSFGPYATRPYGIGGVTSYSGYFYRSNLNFPYTSRDYVPGRHPLRYSGSLYPQVYGAGVTPIVPQIPNVNSGQTTNIYNSPIITNGPTVSGPITQGSGVPYLGGSNTGSVIIRGQTPQPQPVARPADVIVRLPSANAKLWFQGIVTKQTGTLRTFASPSLPPGKEFKYTIRAVWQENGQPVERKRTIVVRSGARVEVDFSQGGK